MTTDVSTGLDAVFRPATVAVYGASAEQPDRLGNQLLRNALSGLGAAATTVVHPRAVSVEGHAAVGSLDGGVDLALISVPAPRAEAALTDAAVGGARAAVILSSGFGETGPSGLAVEQRLLGVARDAGMRLIGPNCMGVVSDLGDRWLNASYFWSVPDTAGPLSFVSQSGAFGGMFFAELHRRGLGLARFVSLGNSADVTETDVLDWLADDDVTGVVAIFAEAIGGGRHFVEAARRVTAHKPVVIVKGGKESAGARASASHTGSMAGAHAAARAAFRRADVIEVPDSSTFFDAVAALASATPRPPSRRVAVVTISGGPAVLAADAAERAGLELPAPSPATVARLRELLPPFAATGNPFDFTPQCPSDRFVAAFAAVASDDSVDGMIVINCGLDVPEFGEAAAAVARAGTPMTAFVLDTPSVAAALGAAGVALFDAPERAVTGYAIVSRP